jgi:hypothetical protein
MDRRGRLNEQPSGFVITLRAVGLQAMAGLVVWIAAVIVAATVPLARLDLTDLLLLFGQLVAVPMGLLLFQSSAPLADALQLNARILFRLAALAALVAALLPQGFVAAAVASLWLLPAGFVGLAAAADAAHRRDAHPGELARLLSAGFLVAGAAFFVAHRDGLTPFGFSAAIIELTAVHFTFTGYGLLLIGAELTRWTRKHGSPASGGLGTSGVVLLMSGLLVTPVGFTIAPVLQVVGAVAVATAVVALAASSALVATNPRLPRLARPWLLVAPATSVLVGGLAGWYAITEAAGAPAWTIGQMAAWHGSVAAFGVVGSGLIGWRLVFLLDR